MSEINLREELAAVLAPHVYNGHQLDAELGDVLDAICTYFGPMERWWGYRESGRYGSTRIALSEAEARYEAAHPGRQAVVTTRLTAQWRDAPDPTEPAPVAEEKPKRGWRRR